MLDPDGDPPGAEWLNQLVAAGIASRITVDPASGLEMTTSAYGCTISLAETPDVEFKVTFVGPSGSYSWIEQICAAGGGWTDGPRKGFCSSDPARSGAPPDPAWEAGNNVALPPGWRDVGRRDKAVGRLTFKAGTCS